MQGGGEQLKDESQAGWRCAASQEKARSDQGARENASLALRKHLKRLNANVSWLNPQSPNFPLPPTSLKHKQVPHRFLLPSYGIEDILAEDPADYGGCWGEFGGLQSGEAAARGSESVRSEE